MTVRGRQGLWCAALGVTLILSAGAVNAAEPDGEDDDWGLDEGDVEEVGDVEVVDPDEKAWDPRLWPSIDRAVNVLTARPTRQHAFEMVIDHRTWEPIRENPFYDLLGFDAGSLKIGLGLRFGILDSLDAGFYRLSQGREAFDLYELDARWRFLEQSSHFVDASLRAGATWFVQEHATDAAGALAQLLVDRQLGHHIRAGTGFMFHSESTNHVKRSTDTAWSIAVPLWVDVRFTPGFAWTTEAVFNVAGYGADWPVFTTAAKWLTNRHTFAIVLSNTQYTSADGLVANTDRTLKDLIIGFSITRELAL